MKYSGSQIAKNGFNNEDDIAEKFNNWRTDSESQLWLFIMGYKYEDIEYVCAVVLHGSKTDVQVQITVKLKEIIDAQNIQVKLVSNKNGFNQIDKRWVDRYAELWSIPSEVVNIFKRYTGEISPDIVSPKDKRRMFINEFSIDDRFILHTWLERNKGLIINDIIKGRGQFAAEWMLVVQKINHYSRWVLHPINLCINHYGQGGIEFTKRGNIKLGNVTIQRKGGDSGKETANMLQFKINPSEMFDI